MNHRRWCAEYKILPVFPFEGGGKEHTKTRGSANFPGFVEKYFVKYAIPAPPHAAVLLSGDGCKVTHHSKVARSVYAPSLTLLEAKYSSCQYLHV